MYYSLISSMKKAVAFSYDADALAFFTATGITDTTQKSAVNTLVLDLKSYGIWSKMKAIYPMAGGTATTHKYNLKDPRDLDAAFRLVFNGGWTHSGTGALPNGTTAYADTKLIPSSTLTLNSLHLSFYSRTNQAISASCEIGSFDTSAGTPILMLAIRSNTNVPDGYDMRLGTNNGLYSLPGRTDTRGYAINTKIVTNTAKAFWNNANIGTVSIVDSLTNKQLYISARNSNGTANTFSAKQCAFASIGDGLTDTESGNLYTAVQNFNTTLARQI